MNRFMCTYFSVCESLTLTRNFPADSKFEIQIRAPLSTDFGVKFMHVLVLRLSLRSFPYYLTENIRVPIHAASNAFFPFSHDSSKFRNNFTSSKTIHRHRRPHLPNGLTNSSIHTFEMIQLYVKRIPSSAQRLYFTLKRT